jgi:hypothetical protein
MDYKTWNEKIIDAMLGYEQKHYACLEKKHSGVVEKKHLWFTHRKVVECISENYETNSTTSLTCNMLRLIRTGHIERAVNNDKTGKRRKPRTEYLYRLTGKPYKQLRRGTEVFRRCPYVDLYRMDTAYRIWVENRHVPKWFRTMML